MGIVLYLGLYILVLIFLFIAIVYISSLFYSLLKGAPYVPTRTLLIRDILKRSGLKKGMRFLELGCGDGRVVSIAVSDFGATGKGIEINPMLVATARIRTWLNRVDGVELVREDVQHTELKGWNVIFLYLFPALIEKLQSRLLKECARGTVIISHGFRIPALESRLFDTRPGTPYKTYYYRI
ncbi:MAG: class I SAM-dependent methyltransferase [Patescibacteria group bacterium]|nr:class I SAM-dependent methyltransferase [Patescibacteria group bacterium]